METNVKTYDLPNPRHDCYYKICADGIVVTITTPIPSVLGKLLEEKERKYFENGVFLYHKKNNYFMKAACLFSFVAVEGAGLTNLNGIVFCTVDAEKQKLLKQYEAELKQILFDRTFYPYKIVED